MNCIHLCRYFITLSRTEILFHEIAWYSAANVRQHAQLNFAPTISKESQRLAAAQPQRPIHERLGDLARAKFEKQQRLQHEQLERERKVAPFVPKLDSRSQVRVGACGCVWVCVGVWGVYIYRMCCLSECTFGSFHSFVSALEFVFGFVLNISPIYYVVFLFMFSLKNDMPAFSQEIAHEVRERRRSMSQSRASSSRGRLHDDDDDENDDDFRSSSRRGGRPSSAAASPHPGMEIDSQHQPRQCFADIHSLSNKKIDSSVLQTVSSFARPTALFLQPLPFTRCQRHKN